MGDGFEVKPQAREGSLLAMSGILYQHLMCVCVCTRVCALLQCVCAWCVVCFCGSVGSGGVGGVYYVCVVADGVCVCVGSGGGVCFCAVIRVCVCCVCVLLMCVCMSVCVGSSGGGVCMLVALGYECACARGMGLEGSRRCRAGARAPSAGSPAPSPERPRVISQRRLSQALRTRSPASCSGLWDFPARFLLSFPSLFLCLTQNCKQDGFCSLAFIDSPFF